MHSLEYDMVKPLLQEELLFLHADFDSGGGASPTTTGSARSCSSG